MLSRRRFLQAAGVWLGALVAPRAQRLLAAESTRLVYETGIDFNNTANVSFNEVYGNPPLLGRVHGAARIRIFKEPSPRSDSVRNVYWGYVMPVFRSVHGERYDLGAANDIWFEMQDGYVHSGYVVPCREFFQEPEAVPEEGFWGEVSVPIVQQFQRPALQARRWDYDYYKNYWGQVHRVVERAEDDEGRVWYRILDDIEPERPAWVPARTLRRVKVEEFEPISPGVEDKRVVIDLAAQTLVCYEEGARVFQTRIATGTTFTNDQGEEFDLSTTRGTYTVQRKRPSRRMRGGASFGLAYDVNGVPWVTYFSFTGAAVHGAYWHNNFGLPRSHGCINVTPDAAKWVYRWTEPTMGYEDVYRWTEPGERATVIEVV